MNPDIEFTTNFPTLQITFMQLISVIKVNLLKTKFKK